MSNLDINHFAHIRYIKMPFFKISLFDNSWATNFAIQETSWKDAFPQFTKTPRAVLAETTFQSTYRRKKKSIPVRNFRVFNNSALVTFAKRYTRAISRVFEAHSAGYYAESRYYMRYVRHAISPWRVGPYIRIGFAWLGIAQYCRRSWFRDTSDPSKQSDR